jgi:predicted amidohydrolase YtcJ
MPALLLKNANIYTLDKQQNTANTLLIESGSIIGSGDTSDFQSIPHRDLVIQDLEGCTVLPGFTDSHIHLENYGYSLQKIDCEVDSLGECLLRVAERVQKSAPGSWILGHGWNQNNWQDGFPSAAELDRITTQHPVYLTAKSLHAAWVNQFALRTAGITRDTQDPGGGKIQRDQNGEPTGILFETAMQLVSSLIPEPTLQNTISAITNAQKTLLRLGITGVHDFDRSRCFSALQILHLQGNLRIRVIKSIPLESLQSAVDLGMRSGFGDDQLRLGSVKAFADGALGPHTAAMLQAYENEPENFGILMLDQEEIFEYGRIATQNGLSLAVHAIGDRAVHELLNAYEQLRRFEYENKLPQMRHRVEHVQLIHDKDRARLAELGVMASMQPIHAISDMDMADRYWGTRAGGAYAWKNQLAAGAVLAFGSDAPVDNPNPFWGLHAAITRKRIRTNRSWYPEQRLDLLSAVKAYTLGAAYSGGMEAKLGQLAPGYLADLIVLRQDPFRLQPDDIYDLLPVKTMVGGQWEYET